MSSHMPDQSELVTNQSSEDIPAKVKKIKCKKKKKKYFSALESLDSLSTSAPRGSQNPKEITNLKEENEELKKENSLKNAKIQCLNKQIEELNNIINADHIGMVGKGSTVISSKIIELSKRNRFLCSELELYKTKCHQFEKEILATKEELVKFTKEKEEEKPMQEDPSQIEFLKSELSTTKAKLFDAMNQITSLKNEIRFMQKCVKEEIGADTLHSSNGWKGRNQQIIKLQAKVTELSKQLEGSNSSSSSVDRSLQAKLELSRKQEVDQLQKENAELKETISKQQKKMAAMKVRNQNLADDSAIYKSKLDELIYKTKETDSYIEALNTQITKLKSDHSNEIKILLQRLTDMEKIKESVNHELSKFHLIVDNKEKLIEGKGNRIQELESLLLEMQADLRETYGDFLFKCKDLCRGQYLGILNNLEKEKCDVLDQLEQSHSQLKKEIEHNQNLQNVMTKLRLKINKLEHCIKKHEEREKCLYKARKLQQPPPALNHADLMSVELQGYQLKIQLLEERSHQLELKLKEVLNEKEQTIKQLSMIIKNSKEFITEILSSKNNLENTENFNK